MCTLSFIPNEQGYVVAMNRDEKFSRPNPLPPSIVQNAIYPRETSGGTWLAINSSALTFAMLNRNPDGPLPHKLRSRGEVIPALILADTLAETHRRLLEIGLNGIWPFRLLAFSPAEREICEWTWSVQLTRAHHDWLPRHWFSSGLSDTEATRVRGAVVKEAWLQTDAGSLEWLRALHRSHVPHAGAYSICMHRSDATTVSYNEIVVAGAVATFRYVSGPPCERTQFDSEISLSCRPVVPIIINARCV